MVLKQLFEINDIQDRLTFVKANKSELLLQKKQAGKQAGGMMFNTPGVQFKAANASDLVLDIVGNSVGFMDSHMDVSMRGSFNRTVNGGAKNAPFLRDHNHSIEGIIGINKGVSVQEVEIRKLGYDKNGTTEVFVMTVEPKKSYDPITYEKYVDRQIKQHSIGLQYIKIDLAINDPEDAESFKVWEANIDKVINKEIAEQYGFFFPVFEQKVIELSAVVFGSNEYTPILGASDKALPDSPNGTQTDTQNSEILLFYKSLK